MVKNSPKKIIKHLRISGIEVIYTFFLALLITFFFGLGVSAFYNSPPVPEYPLVLSTPTKDYSETQTQEQIDAQISYDQANTCLLYTSPSPRDRTRSRMPSSA